MRLKEWLFGALSAAVLMTALLTWHDNGGGLPQAVAVSLPPSPTRAIASTQPATKQSALSVLPDEVPLTEQIDRLMATHDPENAFRAYALLSECNEFNRDHDRLIFDVAEAMKPAKPGYVRGLRGMSEREKQRDTKLCGAMTERQRQSRLDYLAIAAKAGVSGSATTFAEAGPFGDPSALKTRPGDPLVQEWMALAKAQLISAAEAGTDMSAISYLAANYNGSDLFEKNLLLAYRYNIAMGLIYAEIVGPQDPTSKVMVKESEQLIAMVKDYSPEERAAELIAAQRIVDNLRTQQNRARDQRPHAN